MFGIVVAIGAAMVAFDVKLPAIGEIVFIFLGVPRLHDIGWSGWWAAGVILVEIVIVVVAVLTLTRDDAYIVAGLFVLVVMGLLAVLGLVPGQAGANRFGAQPAAGISFGRKAADPDTVF
jgi:uncharacterized membrane protein YhaH (DUF805 family)